MASIQISGVHVSFPIYHGNSRSRKRTVLAAAKVATTKLATPRLGTTRRETTGGRLQEDAKHRIVVQALRDVSFSLRSGDRLGLVGGNGAGKTTLLRTLAGIYEPVVGRVHVSGTIGALLDPNLGMNMELTGRENIALRGLYNGMARPAIRRLEEDVQEFAELAEFLDLPVRFYSSGMVVRLGFALATAIRPEVLLMDEWFLAGDAAFMDRARERLESMVRGADILVLSSHASNVIQDWSTRVMWLDQGRIVADGDPAEVLGQYLGVPDAALPVEAS